MLPVSGPANNTFRQEAVINAFKLASYGTATGGVYLLIQDEKLAAVACFAVACVTAYMAGWCRGAQTGYQEMAKQMETIDTRLDRHQQAVHGLGESVETLADPLAIPPQGTLKNSVH